MKIFYFLLLFYLMFSFFSDSIQNWATFKLDSEEIGDRETEEFRSV